MTENLPYFIKLDFYRLHCGNAPAFGLFPDGGKAPIKTLLLYQLRMGAAFDNPSIIDNQNLIGILNGGDRKSVV